MRSQRVVVAGFSCHKKKDYLDIIIFCVVPFPNNNCKQKSILLVIHLNLFQNY